MNQKFHSEAIVTVDGLSSVTAVMPKPEHVRNSEHDEVFRVKLSHVGLPAGTELKVTVQEKSPDGILCVKRTYKNGNVDYWIGHCLDVVNFEPLIKKDPEGGEPLIKDEVIDLETYLRGCEGGGQWLTNTAPANSL